MVQAFIQDIGRVDIPSSAAIRLRKVGHNSFDLGRTKCILPIGHNITVEKYLDPETMKKVKDYLNK